MPTALVYKSRFGKTRGRYQHSVLGDPAGCLYACNETAGHDTAPQARKCADAILRLPASRGVWVEVRNRNGGTDYERQF